jgi:hypothetical protein
VARVQRCSRGEVIVAENIRWMCAAGLLVAGLVVLGDGSRLTAVPGPASQATVVVELFASEGCSSCPPADDVLSQLALQQPVSNVHVLALIRS